VNSSICGIALSAQKYLLLKKHRRVWCVQLRIHRDYALHEASDNDEVGRGGTRSLLKKLRKTFVKKRLFYLFFSFIHYL